MVSDLGVGLHGHLALTMTAKEYREQTRFAFVPPHNPGNYPQSMGNAQRQALGTEQFRKNQAMSRKYTAVGVEPVLLSPLVDQLTGL